MSSFGKKNLSLISTFIHGCCEVLNMKLNTWVDIPSKYIDNFCVIVSVAVDIFSKRLTEWHILSGYSPLDFSISLAMDKTNVKNVLLKSSFFPELGCYFFLFVWSFFCFVTCYLDFVFKTENCPLCSEFLIDLYYA